MSLAFFGALVAGMSLAPGALAASGEITRAEANGSWTVGSIAGAVEWTGCEHTVMAPRKLEKPPYGETPWEPKAQPSPPPCEWIPFATIGPASNACSSAGRRWPDSLGAGVSLAWSGGQRKGLGSAEFDLSSVPLSGAPGQLLCLSLVEIGAEPVVCIQLVGHDCPPYWVVRYSYSLDSAPLTTVEAQQALSLPESASSALVPESLPKSRKPRRRCARKGGQRALPRPVVKCKSKSRRDKGAAKN